MITSMPPIAAIPSTAEFTASNATLQAQPDERNQPNEQIEHVAKEFEAVFTAAMIKESLKNAMKTGLGDEESQASSSYIDMTCQQLADFLGRQGLMGIADHITETLATKQNGAPHAQQ